MPPFVPRKRIRDDGDEDQQTPNKKPSGLVAPPRKSTLFDDLDASSTPRSSAKNGSSVLEIEDSQDDDSSLTSLSDADFEDVPGTKQSKAPEPEQDGDEDDEDEDMEFEDVPTSAVPSNVPVPSGDLELVLIPDTRISLVNALGKKGPTKRERQIRISTHCIHVQLLLWHNAIRNAWLCDPLVQGIMLSHLPPRLWSEVERWRKASGLDVPDTAQANTSKPSSKRKGKATRASREWSESSQRLEVGAVDMSHGDPLFRLMKYLAAWWKQRFRVTAPGLRKWGYMTLERLDRLTKAFKKEGHDQEQFGERIPDLEAFRQCALECTGSRDVGAQLFTALLRGLGIEARLVANLQPLGFGWTKLEEADPEKGSAGSQAVPEQSEDASKQKPQKKPSQTKSAKAQPSRRSARTRQPVESDGELAADDSDSDEDLAIEVPQPPQKRGKVYDADLEFPHYWTEVLSPVTKKYLAVDAIVKGVVATNRELVESLEPCGAKADRAKQVMAYVVAHSQDGTAKDVTVRYLKRQMLPGRTKGMRMPVEKIPVYDRHGNVKRHVQHDCQCSAFGGPRTRIWS
jgi:xeroderma pigmentosum group C-complementing protein